jgi:hypothetical protein
MEIFLLNAAMSPHGFVCLYVAGIDPVNDRLGRNLAIVTGLGNGQDFHGISSFPEFIEIIYFIIFIDIIEITVCQEKDLFAAVSI